MAVTHLTIALSATVSSAFAISRGGGLAVYTTGSHTARQVFVAFAPNSGGTFERVHTAVLSGASGIGVTTALFPWGRLEQSAESLAVRSFQVVPVRTG